MRDCSTYLVAFLAFLVSVVSLPDKGFAATAAPCHMVEPGDVALEVSLVLPEGYAVSDDAPSAVTLTSSDPKVIAFNGKPSTAIKNPVFPLKVKARAARGETAVNLEFNVYYCGHKDSSVCKVYRKNIMVPVIVEKGSGTKSVKVSQKITLP
jgi:hypothetical protein